MSTTTPSANTGQQYAQQPFQDQYQQPRPVMPIRTDRSLLKFILLGIITLGIYDLVVMTETTNSVNTMVSRYDGRRSLHFLLMFFFFGWMSCGIAWLVWGHRISNRVGGELQRRGYPRLLSASDFWLWYVLGSLIIVGPFIYLFKLFAAVNTLAGDYNQKG